MSTIAALQLRHYSYEPIEAVSDRAQEEPQTYRKPRGLWLSVEGGGDGWREWCEAESFAGGWTHVYDVELAEDANVLHLSGPGDLDRFHHEWSVPDEVLARWGRRSIDWRAVAEKYDGIIIAPYVWERRLDGEVSEWYYGWDCASGCIWRARAVASISTTHSPPSDPSPGPEPEETP